MGRATFWATFSKTHLVTLFRRAGETLSLYLVCCQLFFVVTNRLIKEFNNSSFRQQRMCVSGLPDGLFSNQNPNLGKFGKDLDWKMFKYFMAI
jgi:hypothetical protein